MHVKYRVRVLDANSREIVGKRENVVEINPNSTSKHILDKLAKKYGEDFEQIVDPRTEAVSLESFV